ncbi:MAG: DNA repair exonuclease [Fimbriimonadaceae bacterium]|nr:DNA repair exonuclease [Fimbriimonadaceae bacterium]
MTIAHLSDTHLGYRAYSRTTPEGMNQREADVLETFRRTLAAIGEREPDLVVHSGDLFHMVRPSNHTITSAYVALLRFQEARRYRPFVLIGGNHDTPRTAESGNLLELFASIDGMRVVPDRAVRESIDALDLELMCVPSRALRDGGERDWTPHASRRNSVLVVHGMAAQALPEHAEFDVAETRADRWSYVALGDYHMRQSYGPNCCYPGSTDFTSTNIWEETLEPKGWAWFDSNLGMLEFVPIATRTVLDLPPIDASSKTGGEITEAAVRAANWDSGALPIVRQKVLNVHADVRRHIDARAIRDVQARALHYQLDLRTLHTGEAAAPAGEGASLEGEWGRHVAHAELPAEVRRERVQTSGLELLRRAEIEADPA